MGYTGSIDVLRRFVSTLRDPDEASQKLTVRFETPPGQQAQADWAYCGKFPNHLGQLVPIYAFVMVLGFSRMMFVRFTTSMKLPVLIRCHQLAFEFFGGWPATILYDNMKQVRISFSQWNKLFVDFAAYHGFGAMTHKPRRPRTKGKVERMVPYVRGNFLNGRTFIDLDDLNAQGLHWLEHTAHTRVHGTTQQRPVDLFAQEKEKLTPCHSIAPFKLVLAEDRIVSSESFVRFGRSFYSVPPEHAGKTVAVAADGGKVIIRSGDLIIAEHPQAAKPGSTVALPEHIEQAWKQSLGHGPAPEMHWTVTFTQQVQTVPLRQYEEVA